MSSVVVRGGSARRRSPRRGSRRGSSRADHRRHGVPGPAQQPQVDRSRSRRARARSAPPRWRRGPRRRGRGRAARASRSASRGCASTRRRRPHRRAPARERRASLGDHRRDGRLDLLAVKRRHHDPPRAVVVGAVDRQQAVAEQRDQVAEARLPPVEVLRMVDRDEPVRLRSEHEDDPAVQEAHAEDRPVALVSSRAVRQRVVRHPLRPGEVEVARPGREGNLPDAR